MKLWTWYIALGLLSYALVPLWFELEVGRHHREHEK